MPFPPKAYYRLSEAAELLGCSVNDLIHWAVNGHTRLGVLYTSDGFYPEAVLHPKYPGEVVLHYNGFAYVDRGYLVDAERTGHFAFTSVELPDGRTVLINPGKDQHPVIEATIDELFILEHEFNVLREQVNLRTERRTRPTTDRDSELQLAANQLAHELKQRGRKMLSKREVAVALAKSDAWSDLTADRIERVIRVEW
jgi:hypothetical protein